jgi:hypothetical protein
LIEQARLEQLDAGLTPVSPPSRGDRRTAAIQQIGFCDERLRLRFGPLTCGEMR